MHYMDANIKVWRKSLKAITQECCKQYWTSARGNTPQNSSYTATYHLSQKLSKLDKPDMQDTAGEVRMTSQGKYSSGSLHMDKQRQDNQLEPIYNSSVRIQDIALKTYLERYTKEKGGGRGSGISMLAAQQDDDDDDDTV